MESGYRIYRKLDNGEQLVIGAQKTLSEAEQLVRSLAEHWPAEYVIQAIESPSPE